MSELSPQAEARDIKRVTAMSPPRPPPAAPDMGGMY